MDCGPTCLKMVAAYHGKNISIQSLRDYCQISKNGVSMADIAKAAEKIGILATGGEVGINNVNKLPLPCIIHWDQKHFVVLYKVSKNKYIVADPAKAILTYTQEEFSHYWSQNRSKGIVLKLEPKTDFFDIEEDKERTRGFSTFFRYLFRYKKLLFQLIAGFLLGSLLQVILPFLTQSIVDIGINTQNLKFIHIVLMAQFMLLISRMGVDFLRSWILLHISTRLNIYILTDFLSKLMKLPISFFDTKRTGDILQRINDQKRIEFFLTNHSLNITFSFFSLLVFSLVLFFYSSIVFSIFFIGSALYAIWIIAFLNKRKQLDYKSFDLSAKNQNVTIQIINGMQEIKLAGAETEKRWGWEHVQAKLFRYNVKSLALGQYQQFGAVFFSEGKNLIIIFIVANAVVEGRLTLGAMLAIQYILGQLNSPVEQLLSFIQSYQDAKISMDRLNNIFSIEDEEVTNKNYLYNLPSFESISLEDVSFTYPGTNNVPVLNKINLEIRRGQTTAIVGMSGGGKTTLLRLLLGFYQPSNGALKIGKVHLSDINPSYWRKICGVVMQDGFIFSDTIAANITLGDSEPNAIRVWDSIKAACLDDFVSNLPLGVNTIIGADGNGLSQGQKQRLLISRAIYKNPEFIFLDEATNSLDSSNEKSIIRNINQFFSGKTLVVVAHRLSTVKNADRIVVLDQGRIVEQGTHSELLKLEGKYFQLVSNQLETNI